MSSAVSDTATIRVDRATHEVAHRAPLLTSDPELLLPSAPWAHEDLHSS